MIKEVETKKTLLTEDFKKNIAKINETFSYPLNKDFVPREIYVKAFQKNGMLFYLEGTTNKDLIEEHIIRPLLYRTTKLMSDDPLNNLIQHVIEVTEAKKVVTFDEVRQSILNGKTILLIDEIEGALAFDTIRYEHRNVERPQNEMVIKGPHEAFVESPEVNRSLVRKLIKDESLITETIITGKKTLTNISMLYIKDVADPELVSKVRKRVSEIQVDGELNISLLEQHIEERPYSLVPTVLFTERPDRAAAFLLEGHVVLINDSPACLIVPVTFWSLFHSGEDMYERWAYGNFIRLVRLFGYFIALLTPGIYIAATNFHIAMIPIDLLLAIAATREIVPFPGLIEVILMEISFELVREAGIRVPAPMGPTIGIVGALILGQAAVEARIISPIMVIVVGITGLSSFIIPDTSMNFMVRITRFLFLIVGASFGFFGMSLLLVLGVAYLSSITSFDVPFFAPMAPHYPSSHDLLVRPPVWKQWLRPLHIRPKEKIRKKPPEGSES